MTPGTTCVLLLQAIASTGYLLTCFSLPSGQRGETPLWLAAGAGRRKVVRCLVLDGHAEVDARDQRQRTPLLVAAEAGHLKVVRFLVFSGGADISARDTSGMTVLAAARGSDRDEVVVFLEQRGAPTA